MAEATLAPETLTQPVGNEPDETTTNVPPESTPAPENTTEAPENASPPEAPAVPTTYEEIEAAFERGEALTPAQIRTRDEGRQERYARQQAENARQEQLKKLPETTHAAIVGRITDALTKADVQVHPLVADAISSAVEREIQAALNQAEAAYLQPHVNLQAGQLYRLMGATPEAWREISTADPSTYPKLAFEAGKKQGGGITEAEAKKRENTAADARQKSLEEKFPERFGTRVGDGVANTTSMTPQQLNALPPEEYEKVPVELRRQIWASARSA